jgi:hypothetical protein
MKKVLDVEAILIQSLKQRVGYVAKALKPTTHWNKGAPKVAPAPFLAILSL